MNSPNKFVRLSKALLERIEKFLPLIIIGSFALGMFLASISEGFAYLVNRGMSAFIDGYGYIAPLAILLILAPSFARMLNARRAGAFAGYTILWLSIRRLLCSFWAVLFTVLIFDIPLLPQRTPGVREALFQSFQSLGWMVTRSPYFMAIWLAILIGILSHRFNRLFKFLDGCAEGVERVGQYFTPLILLFMLVVGAYVYTLPQNLADQIKFTGQEVELGRLSILGFQIDPSRPFGMVTAYIAGALLVGLCCFIWHFLLLGWTKRTIKEFSIRRYFARYWIKVYPLLWATSSEALATPLNLFLVKKHFPQIKREVRRFVIGMGSYLNINGTVICVFVLAGLVANIAGIRLSALELLLSIPVIFLLSFGVPGIPGELVLFAGPLVILLNVPEVLVPAFLALYVGLQIGLPDSFRTGNNSTDDCVCALLLNKVYEKRFLKEEEEIGEPEDE